MASKKNKRCVSCAYISTTADNMRMCRSCGAVQRLVDGGWRDQWAALPAKKQTGEGGQLSLWASGSDRREVSA